MADESDRPSDEWGNTVGRWTFILTVILTALYLGAVLLFIR